MKETFISNQDIQLWTYVQGNGIPILLCNGGPGSADYLGPVASMIDDIAFAIRFEQRGCGRSSPSGPYDLKTTLTDLERIREYYKVDSWVVSGHSWGANLSLAYALEYPNSTQGLIYISGNGAQHDVDWRNEYKKARAEMGEQMPDMSFPGNAEVNHKGNASWYDYIKQPRFWRRVSELGVPSLFVYGTRDVRPSWPAEQLANLIPGARQAFIDGAAHYIWLTHSDQLKSIVRTFIKDKF
jgi:proline iminopeptidase